MSLLCTLLAPAQGSVLTVRQTMSSSVARMTLGTQCLMNGWFYKGDWCLGVFTVPQGWQFTVIGHTEQKDCGGEFPHVGRTLREGEEFRIKSTSPITSMWVNSGLKECYLHIDGRLISPAGLNSTLIASSQKSGGFNRPTRLYYGYAPNYVETYMNMNMSRWTGGMKLNELTMDVADNIVLRQGETARLFTVRNSTTGDGSVRVTLSGDAAASLTTYKNGSVANCDGKTFGAGGYCEIRVAPNVPWFGERKARANVTVTIN